LQGQVVVEVALPVGFEVLAVLVAVARGTVQGLVLPVPQTQVAAVVQEIAVPVRVTAVVVLVGTDAPFRGSYQEQILQQKHNLCLL
jgi:hypothetical protein